MNLFLKDALNIGNEFGREIHDSLLRQGRYG
jgi:hypothetical protein